MIVLIVDSFLLTIILVTILHSGTTYITTFWFLIVCTFKQNNTIKKPPC